MIEPVLNFPIQSVQIDWERLKATRQGVLNTVENMPPYLIKPEIMDFLTLEKHPTYPLILDLMWTTDALISEVLALTPTAFVMTVMILGCDSNPLNRALDVQAKRPLNAHRNGIFPLWTRCCKIGFKVFCGLGIFVRMSVSFLWPDKQ